MILHKVSVQGLPAFPRAISVDFDSLPTVIALTGPNGSGKTTFLDCLAAPFYLSMPFRPGPLHKHFETRGFVDLTWQAVPDGPRYRSRINVDPVAERVEASLFPADGGPALAGPLTKNYLEALRQIGVLPLEVFLSTAYTVQPSSTTAKNFFSFLIAGRAERREILAELLGLRFYGIREGYAKDRIKALSADLVTSNTLIRQLEPAASTTQASEAVKATTGRLTEALTTRDDLRNALEERRKAVTAANEALAVLVPLKASQDVVAAEIDDLHAKRTAAERTLAAAQADIAAAKDVQDVPAAKEALVAQRAGLLPVKDHLGTVTAEVTALEFEQAEIDQRLLQDQEILAHEAAFLAATTAAADKRVLLTALEADIDAAMNADSVALTTYHDWLSISNDFDTKRTELTSKQGERNRLVLAGQTMEEVPCKGQAAYAGCQFLVQAAEAGRRLPEVLATLDLLSAELADLQTQVGEPRAQPIATAPPLRRQRAILVQEIDLLKTQYTESTFASARTRADGLHDRKQRVAVALEDKRRTQAEYTEQLRGLPQIDVEIQRLEPLAALAMKLAPAKAIEAQVTDTLAGIRQTLESKTMTLAEIRQTLAGLPQAETAVRQSTADVLAGGLALQQSENRVGTLERELGVAQATLAAAEAAGQKLERLQGELRPLEAALEDWTLIARSQSAAGIPALRVDRALPEIGERATALLAECLEQILFTVQLVTQKQSADDKKLLETLDVLILRAGKVLDAALLSGGEGVLVSEALALSIALYNAERGKTRPYTLFRDEVGAALDADRAPAYTKLLARAARVGSFDKVLFVSHHRRALELADARLGFDNGTITLS